MILHYDSRHMNICLECASPNNWQHILSFHVNSGLRKKMFYLIFLRKKIRKHGFLERFFVSIYVFLYLTPSCQRLKPSSSEMAFGDWRLAFADFRGDEIPIFNCFFLFESRIVTWNLRCYLLIVHCLNSPLHALWH